MTGEGGAVWPETQDDSEGIGACAESFCGTGQQASALSDAFDGLRSTSSGKVGVRLSLSANAPSGIAEVMISIRTAS